MPLSVVYACLLVVIICITLKALFVQFTADSIDDTDISDELACPWLWYMLAFYICMYVCYST
jgi:hypothetical protein